MNQWIKDLLVKPSKSVFYNKLVKIMLLLEVRSSKISLKCWNHLLLVKPSKSVKWYLNWYGICKMIEESKMILQTLNSLCYLQLYRLNASYWTCTAKPFKDWRILRYKSFAWDRHALDRDFSIPTIKCLSTLPYVQGLLSSRAAYT